MVSGRRVSWLRKDLVWMAVTAVVASLLIYFIAEYNSRLRIPDIQVETVTREQLTASGWEPIATTVLTRHPSLNVIFVYGAHGPAEKSKIDSLCLFDVRRDLILCKVPLQRRPWLIGFCENAQTMICKVRSEAPLQAASQWLWRRGLRLNAVRKASRRDTLYFLMGTDGKSRRIGVIRDTWNPREIHSPDGSYLLVADSSSARSWLVDFQQQVIISLNETAAEIGVGLSMGDSQASWVDESRLIYRLESVDFVFLDVNSRPLQTRLAVDSDRVARFVESRGHEYSPSSTVEISPAAMLMTALGAGGIPAWCLRIEYSSSAMNLLQMPFDPLFADSTVSRFVMYQGGKWLLHEPQAGHTVDLDAHYAFFCDEMLYVFRRGPGGGLFRRLPHDGTMQPMNGFPANQ